MHGRDLRTRDVASIDEYLDLLGYPQGEVAARLLAIVRTHYPQLREDVKWHVPVYSLDATPIVSIEEFKVHVNLKFFKGARIAPASSKATGKGIRHIKFHSPEDVDEGKIRDLIDQTLERVTTR